MTEQDGDQVNIDSMLYTGAGAECMTAPYLYLPLVMRMSPIRIMVFTASSEMTGVELGMGDCVQ